MPGPMSAPNGIANTWQPRDPNRRIITGKTAVKRGQDPRGDQRRNNGYFRQSRQAQKAQEED